MHHFWVHWAAPKMWTRVTPKNKIVHQFALPFFAHLPLAGHLDNAVGLGIHATACANSGPIA